MTSPLSVGAADLDRMLVASVGRPWREVVPGLTRVEIDDGGAGLRIKGRVGPVLVQVEVREVEDRTELNLVWSNPGSERIDDLVVGLAVPGPERARVTIPQVIYHDNPSAAPDRIVPHVSRGGFVTEVHRLPIPAVCLQGEDGATLTLVTVPDPDEDPQGRVRYGSLGAVTEGGSSRALALSGVTLFDGAPDVTYVDKARTTPSREGYRSLEPGASIRQRFVLVSGWAPVGHGFREVARVGREMFGKGGDAVIPGPHEADQHIELRLAALDARAFTEGDVAGYQKFPAWGMPRTHGANRPAVDFLYGWTGQCLRLAWCEAWVGLERGEEERLERAHAVVEFYVNGSGTAVPGMRHNSYVHDDRRWHGQRLYGREIISARAHGETMSDLADLVRLYRRFEKAAPQVWLVALREAAEFIAATTLPSGIPPLGWTAAGEPADDLECAAGIPAAHSVAKAAAVLGDDRLLGRAVEMAQAYHGIYGGTFDRPFARSTLDAACEDKEGGLAYLELLMTMHEVTGNAEYLQRALVTADWLLTWVYHWNPVQDRGASLRERGFSAIGWPGVSVQNHHLDVFFPSHDLLRLGIRTGDERLQRWARTIVGAMSQGICTAPGEWEFDVVGEQAEAFYVTNWQHRGFSNTWNPSWVIAHPLWQLLEIANTDKETVA
ncbi:hypothetical protein [Pseudactinotalea sp.]|uniref:hypothetical protein n=1 Tax=Pseudactinotalea sp. TaxID=1926260 RepID=UPI003B3AC079